jgi:hypothetical protein
MKDDRQGAQRGDSLLLNNYEQLCLPALLSVFATVLQVEGFFLHYWIFLVGYWTFDLLMFLDKFKDGPQAKDRRAWGYSLIKPTGPGRTRRMKIPPNPPFSKGGVKVPLWQRGI